MSKTPRPQNDRIEFSPMDSVESSKSPVFIRDERRPGRKAHRPRAHSSENSRLRKPSSKGPWGLNLPTKSTPKATMESALRVVCEYARTKSSN